MPEAGARAHPRRLPGEDGIWVFVLGDMVIFGMLFVTYLYYRSYEVALFDASQQLLSIRLGVLNTLLLLSSSWFVVAAIDFARKGQARKVRTFIGCAFLCGVGFVGVKYIEYSNKIGHGINLFTDHFFRYYFMYTGIHLIHVMLGLAMLAYLWRKAGVMTVADVPKFEIGATFWHMVDLLWIMLFALLYLLK